METREYGLKINHDAKLILVTGITSNPVSIDFSGDVDFTKLVTELTQSIDSKRSLIAKSDNDTSEESALKLILETIDSIIKEYNNTITSLVEDVEEGEDSEIDMGHDSEIGDDDADLPF